MHFSSVIGQDIIKQQLKSLLQSGKMPHALLFAGPEGCGKLPMALAFASALLCEERTADGEPCGHCKACKMLANWAHPDLHFAFPVFKPTGQKQPPVSDQFLPEWREQLQAEVYFTLRDWQKRMGVENQQTIITAAEADNIVRKLSIVTSQGGYRVVIIWLPELMNLDSANKTLKILEEPPAKTVFLLVSNSPEKLLSTIVSRTQRISFSALAESEVAEALMSTRGLQEEDAKTIAHSCAGNYMSALAQVTNSVDEALFFDMFVLLMRQSYARNIKELSAWSEQVAKWGREQQKSFLAYCQRLVRENFVYNFGLPELNYMSATEAEFAVRFARFINERNVIGITEELAKAQRDIEQNVNPKMVFYEFALKNIVLLVK